MKVRQLLVLVFYSQGYLQSNSSIHNNIEGLVNAAIGWGLSVLSEIFSQYSYTDSISCSTDNNLTLSTNKNSTIFNRPSDWLMAES